MAIPAFLSNGDLPLGVHTCTLAEVRQQLGSMNSQRTALMQRLERIHSIAAQTGFLRRFIVFGSFVTAKEVPRDVDIFMIMEDRFDAGGLTGEGLIAFDHLAADAYFGCSIFWVRRLAALGGEQATVEHWQVCRGGGKRGIIEIVEDRP